MNEYAKQVDADARLVILKELSMQMDGRLNSTVLTHVLEAFGHRRSREWFETQLNALAENGAIRLASMGTVLIAEITRTGREHVERRRVLAGVARPSNVAD